MDDAILRGIKAIHKATFTLWHRVFIPGLPEEIVTPTHSRAAPDLSSPEKTLEAGYTDSIRRGINETIHKSTKWVPLVLVILSACLALKK